MCSILNYLPTKIELSTNQSIHQMLGTKTQNITYSLDTQENTVGDKCITVKMK